MKSDSFQKIDTLVLNNGLIPDLHTHQFHKRSLHIENGVINEICAQPIEIQAGHTVDCTNQIISPGLIDLHVHFREPGFEHKETLLSGANSALAGGFTTVCTMPNTNPAFDSVEQVLVQREKTRDHLVKVIPIAAITKGRQGQQLVDMSALKAAGVVGFSDDGSAVQNTALIRRALQISAELNVPVIEHCEDPFLAAGGVMQAGAQSQKLGVPGIPGIAEDVIVARDILLAEETGGKLHIAHISTAKSVALVRYAKARGVSVTCEVAPHHFVLTDAAVQSLDPDFKMNPPLRSPADREAILEGLADGTIDVIASDHAPHSPAEKQAGFLKAPFGIIGLETMLALTITFLVERKVLSLAEAIAKMTVKPAAVIGTEMPQIDAGTHANLTIFDPVKSWQIDKYQMKSKSRNTPFHGWTVRGKVLGVIHQGKYWLNK